MKKGPCTWGSGCVSLWGCHGRLVIAKGSEKWKILSQILNKSVENLDNLSCPPASALVFRNEKGECDWICSSYPLRHLKTLHCAERKAYVYGLWTKTHLGL